jgi:hypothetical protein
MSQKHLIRFGSGAVGLICAVAAGHWNKLTGPIQMAMHSVLIVGLMLVGIWSDRRHPRFAIAICSMLAVHGLVLFAMRGLFPFSTILTVIPLFMMEGMMLFAVMLKILDVGRTTDDF